LSLFVAIGAILVMQKGKGLMQCEVNVVVRVDLACEPLAYDDLLPTVGSPVSVRIGRKC